MLDAQAIKNNLKYECNIISLETVNSTNTYAKENNLRDGDLVITAKQTAGKGRLGRVWECEGGIAFSVNLIPEQSNSNLAVVSLIMGTAVCEALRAVSGLDFQIKWPNDIIYNGKKICGILTEAITQNSQITKVICGVGVNINKQNFSDSLKNKATSMLIECQKEFDVNYIIALILNRFNKYLQQGWKLPDTFKSLCITIGKNITVVNSYNSYNATAIDVDTDGNLIVKNENDEIVKVSSGEVSVRGIYGYN